MKNNLSLTALALTILLSFAGSLPAQDLKVATVDIIELFKAYYKTPIENKSLQEEVARLKKEDEERMEKLHAIQSELIELKEIADNTKSSREDRNEAAKKYQTKMANAQASRKEYREISQRRFRAIKVRERKMLKLIKEDITAIIASYCEPKDYDLVFDKAGITNINLPAVLYNKGATDITADVMKVLNDAAPATEAAE